MTRWPPAHVWLPLCAPCIQWAGRCTYCRRCGTVTLWWRSSLHTYRRRGAPQAQTQTRTALPASAQVAHTAGAACERLTSARNLSGGSAWHLPECAWPVCHTAHAIRRDAGDAHLRPKAALWQPAASCMHACRAIDQAGRHAQGSKALRLGPQQERVRRHADSLKAPAWAHMRPSVHPLICPCPHMCVYAYPYACISLCSGKSPMVCYRLQWRLANGYWLGYTPATNAPFSKIHMPPPGACTHVHNRPDNGREGGGGGDTSFTPSGRQQTNEICAGAWSGRVAADPWVTRQGCDFGVQGREARIERAEEVATAEEAVSGTPIL